MTRTLLPVMLVATRFRLLLLSALTISSLPGTGVNFTTFTTPPSRVGSNGTIGFAYAGDMFVGSVFHSGLNSLYSTDLNGKNQQVFAPTVSIPGGDVEEHFVASSLGLSGFPSRDIYVGINGGIMHISHDGSRSNTFVSGLNGYVRGILFDPVGSFGNDMLVTTDLGSVYRINSAGAVALLANVGEIAEGLDVAPLTFASNPGYLYVGSEGSGTIRAISPTGSVKIVANVPSAEMLSFVPTAFGGNPVEGFYESNYRPDVLKADPDQFANYLGDIIVTSEIGGQVTALHWDGNSFASSSIGQFPNFPEDGILVTQRIVNPSPEPETVVLVAVGIGLGSLLRRRFREVL